MSISLKCNAADIRKSLDETISEKKPHIDRIVQQILDELHELFFADTKKMLTSHHFSHKDWYMLVNDKVCGGRDYDSISKEEIPELIDEIEIVEKKVLDALVTNGFRIEKSHIRSDETYCDDPEYDVIWGISETDCKGDLH